MDTHEYVRNQNFCPLLGIPKLYWTNFYVNLRIFLFLFQSDLTRFTYDCLTKLEQGPHGQYTGFAGFLLVQFIHVLSFCYSWGLGVPFPIQDHLLKSLSKSMILGIIQVLIESSRCTFTTSSKVKHYIFIIIYVLVAVSQKEQSSLLGWDRLFQNSRVHIFILSLKVAWALSCDFGHTHK